MKPRYKKIITAAIENGVNQGWDYAHKYVSSPSKKDIKEAILDQIMNELQEWFELDND